jgi:predicted metal-dependent phosphoesterase TrpH/glycosyltransferase involved in cell wall biosynthesis
VVADRFSIAQVTPYPWGLDHEVNTFVARCSARLAARGHRVLIVAPSDSQAEVRRARQAMRAAREDPDSLLEDRRLSRTEEGVPVVCVGEVLTMPPSSSRRGALPIDVARTVEELLGLVALDFVHVHEPFAPSTSSAALRHSRSLNVGSFHSPTERVVSTQLARKVVELFFGRLDARTASLQTTRELMQRYFPGDYRVVLAGADPADPALARTDGTGAPMSIAFIEEEERPALRMFLRALRRLGTSEPWEASVVSRRGASSSTPLRAQLRERVHFLTPGQEAGVLAQADVLVCASDGTTPAPGLVLRALAAGVVPLVARLPSYEEVVGEGERGLLFEPRDVETLAAQLARMIGDEGLRANLRAAGEGMRGRLSWDRVTDELEAVYEEVAARRHAPSFSAPLSRRVRARRLIDVDLHMHTDHSHDCATPVEVLLAAARAQGLGAIAITDHNEISGALEAQAKAEGIKIIVAEEVKTAHQGEVIGLFISERIERGLSLAQTVAEIRRQGGLVYVPHPFDRLHSVPDYEHLLTILEDVDAIEVFNPRVAIGSFNDEAARFAAKYRIPAGAGSDSHVPQGLGSVRVRMHDFEGPEEFMVSLHRAEIVTRPTSLLYVQALKFLQTRATPAGAREAQRERRVRRAARKS